MEGGRRRQEEEEAEEVGGLIYRRFFPWKNMVWALAERRGWEGGRGGKERAGGRAIDFELSNAFSRTWREPDIRLVP